MRICICECLCVFLNWAYISLCKLHSIFQKWIFIGKYEKKKNLYTRVTNFATDSNPETESEQKTQFHLLLSRKNQDESASLAVSHGTFYGHHKHLQILFLESARWLKCMTQFFTSADTLWLLCCGFPNARKVGLPHPVV